MQHYPAWGQGKLHGVRRFGHATRPLQHYPAWGQEKLHGVRRLGHTTRPMQHYPAWGQGKLHGRAERGGFPSCPAWGPEMAAFAQSSGGRYP
jgi:hypothetical protein